MLSLYYFIIMQNSAGSFSVGVSKAIEGSRIKKVYVTCNTF